MRKFKLIKEYPNSPKLGFITEDKHYIKNSAGDFLRIGYNDTYIKDLTGFWEEVFDKDYEILSFINSENTIFNIGQRICSGSMYPETIEVNESLINDSLYKNLRIHSVKRLSDGEIFTISDEVVHTNNVTNKIGIIENFHIMSNDIWFKTNNYNVPICYIKNKNKTPLFITEDKVAIFRGDKYYYVDIKTFRIWSTFAGNTADEVFWLKDKNLIKFSTKEIAEEYGLMNKPCLSINDIAKVYITANRSYSGIGRIKTYEKQAEKLREIVKSKL